MGELEERMAMRNIRERIVTSFFTNQANNKYKSLRAVGLKKRVSLCASITIEAALALPLFIFFFVNILTLFDIIRLQSAVQAALHQTGNTISFNAYYSNQAADLIGKVAGKEEFDSDDLNAIGIAQSIEGMGEASYRVKKYLSDDYIYKSCLSDELSGISFLGSKIMLGNDIVDIVASYKVHPIIKIIGFSEFRMETRYYGHAWTGYEIEDFNSDNTSEDEQIVYIAETGTVYHNTPDCTYLDPSVSSVSSSEVESKRSQSGAKFHPCEICGGVSPNGIVYITNYGTRYHNSTACSGIKRTVHAVKLSEVGGRPCCSKCG